jgi:hypothetical protein
VVGDELPRGFVPLSGALYTLVMLLSVGLYAPLITTDLVFSEQYKIGTLKNEISYGIPEAASIWASCAGDCRGGAGLRAGGGTYLALCVPTLPLEADPDGMLMAETGGCGSWWAGVCCPPSPVAGAQGVAHLCFSCSARVRLPSPLSAWWPESRGCSSCGAAAEPCS